MSVYTEYYFATLTQCMNCGEKHIGTCSEGKYLNDYTCKVCGEFLDSFELEENKKPIPYASKPICYKCASNRI
jgi:hypothetical protein